MTVVCTMSTREDMTGTQALDTLGTISSLQVASGVSVQSHEDDDCRFEENLLDEE